MAEGKTDVLAPPQPQADERAALEAERREIEALEKKVQTEEEKFALRKRREEIDERVKRVQKLTDLEEQKRLEEIEEKKRLLEEAKQESGQKKLDTNLRRQAEEEEKAFITDLCAVLPDDERNQLSWALFKIEPGKGELQVTNIPLSPDLNIYDSVRDHCPEGGQFHLKLMKGGVFATRKTIGALVKSEQAKQLIMEIPLSFKIQLYEARDQEDYPKAGYGRLRPDFGGGVRRFGGYTSPPPDYAGLPGYRGSRLPVTPEQIELQKERERDERLERKEERDDAKQERTKAVERLEKERDQRLIETRENFNNQMQMFTTMLKESKGGGNGQEIQSMITLLKDTHASQTAIIKDSYDRQLGSVKEELVRLREKTDKPPTPPPVEPKREGSDMAMFQVLKESTQIQATVLKESNESARRASEAQASASKEAAIAQAQAMKEATMAQAEALKSALSGQSEMQKQVMQMQTESMKDIVGRMMGDFKGTIENMMKQQERDRDAMLKERAAEREAADKERQRDRESLKAERDAAEKERQRERDNVKSERERDRDMNKTMVDLWKDQAGKKQGGDQMMDSAMKMANNLMANSMKSIEAQMTIASKVNKMFKKMDEDDEEEEPEEKKKSEFDKILDIVQPPLMKVLDIALEQAKQGKDPAQIHADAERNLQEQVRKQAEEKAAMGGTGEPRKKERRESEPESGDQFDEALKEFRDEIIPLVTNAVVKNADEDWLVGYMMSEDFPASARTLVALMDVSTLHKKLLKFATAEEKAVLNAQGAIEYLDKVQKRMMEVQKKLKEAEREQDKEGGAQPTS